MNGKRRPNKTVPDEELRKKLLKIALQTDFIADYPTIENWRMSAIISARWLLRVAAEAPTMPRAFQHTILAVRQLSDIMNGQIDSDKFRLRRLPYEIDHPEIKDEVFKIPRYRDNPSEESDDNEEES